MKCGSIEVKPAGSKSSQSCSHSTTKRCATMKTDLMMLCRLGVAPALAAMVLGGCGSAKPAPAPPPPQVSVVTVHRGSVPITTELPGRTSAYLVAQVRARDDVIVLKRDFKEGGEVKAGQRL